VNNEVKISLRLDLSGDLADKFVWLKRRLGLKHNSEVVRQILTEAYRARAEIGEEEPSQAPRSSERSSQIKEDKSVV